jgi:phosphatidate cytidylyltransferase
LIFNLSITDRNIIYLIILISFINDTIAYIVGSYVKGPLISPKISPKKTWSGTFTSFLVSMSLFLYLDFNLIIAAIMAISLFYGDIYFSFIKRKLVIKDFSRLLSSHGGMLDRLDSFTFLIIIFSILNI